MNDATPRLSSHARSRWAERCPGLCLETEWRCARRPGKAVRRKIQEKCPCHAPLMRGRIYRGFFYAYSPRSRVVFVVGQRTGEDVIVTVWRMEASDGSPSIQAAQEGAHG